MEKELKRMQEANEAAAKKLQEKQSLLKQQLGETVDKARSVEKDIH